MAWRRPGDKSLSETMMVSTLPQWVNDAIHHHRNWSCWLADHLAPKYMEAVMQIQWISDQNAFIFSHVENDFSKNSWINVMRNVPFFMVWLLILFVFSCDQAALWMVFSVCLSVCLSVRLSVTHFWLCSHHRIIMKFSGVITTDQGNVHAKGQGQRSKVKVTEVTTQLDRFRTVTPVWIHIWWWNDAYSLMLLRRGALLFFKVIRQISRSHGSKNRRIWPKLGVSGL